MGIFALVGLGISGSLGLPKRVIEELKNYDYIFFEKYTSPIPDLDLEKLKEELGKGIKELRREEVESTFLVELAEKSNVALLCGGDPLIATTHLSLILMAKRKGIKYKVFHSSSIYTAAPGACGLQIYKFGRSTTIPKPTRGFFPESPYLVIRDNLKLGLHTLVLLDTLEGERTLKVNEGLKILEKIEEKRKEGVIRERRLVIGLSDLGSESEIIKAGYVKDLIEEDFPGKCQCMIFPGKLHFLEAEALVELAGAPEEILGDGVASLRISHHALLGEGAIW